MDDSVFYPGPPVFRGATFIDALSETAAGDVLTQVGPDGVVDFFCFMLQVHETVHRHQTGEPLLNEVVQAALWSKFLSEESMWSFQRDTRGSLVREAALAAHFPLLADAAAAARLDTAEMITAIAVDNTYFACCLLACRFDTGSLRYSDYLARLSQLLTHRWDSATTRAVTLALL
jgi:hypothetical protein